MKMSISILFYFMNITTESYFNTNLVIRNIDKLFLEKQLIY